MPRGYFYPHAAYHQAMEGAGYRPDGGLLTRLTMSHADVLEREAQEIAAAAAGPPEDWGMEMEMAGDRIQRGRPGEIDGDYIIPWTDRCLFRFLVV